MKLAGKILKGIVKTSINIDLNNDGKSDGKISPTIPDIKLPDYFKNASSKVLIFDDLERCSIEIPNILGYINQFIENKGTKVIILGNEEQIIKDEKGKTIDDSRRYINIKEKVIGKSFNIEADFELAYTYFINQVNNKKTKKIIITNKSIVKETYNIAGYMNLRHLRQTILDFERLLDFFPVKAIRKNDFLLHILKLFFAISFEIKKGSIIENEIPKLFRYDFWIRQTDEPKTNYQVVREKYSVFDDFHNHNEYLIWTSFLKFGKIDNQLFEESIQNSIYFQDENTPNWVKLWRFRDLEDDEFKPLFDLIFDDFKESKIENKYVVVHITGILIHLAEIKLINQNKIEIIKLGKKNLESLKSKGLLRLNRFENFPGKEGYSLGYKSRGNNEFMEFIIFARELANKATEENLSKKADILLLKMKPTSIVEFGQQLFLDDSSDNFYFDIPILVHFQISKFVKAYLELPNKDKSRIAYILDKRYKCHDYNNNLFPELKWLLELQKTLKKERQKLLGTISGHIIEDTILKSIEKAIIELKKVSREKKQ